jgi:hypothetical protein
VLPGLATHSLVSIARLCNNGCTVAFDNQQLVVRRDDQDVLLGPRDPQTKLWLLPLRPGTNTTVPSNAPQPAIQLSNFVLRTSSPSGLIQYLHAACFHAIRNNQFTMWPGLTSAAVLKYLPPSMATAKGHLDQARKNQRSTKKPVPAPRQTGTPENNATEASPCDMNPPQQAEPSHAIFAAIGLADVHNGVIYTDLTGAFPVTSLEGNKYILILYDYNSNAILAAPMKNRSDVEALQAYEKLYTILRQRGLKPALNILDNEASTALKRQILASGARYQLVELNNH